MLLSRATLLLLACMLPCLAQNASVAGRVLNQAGEPLKNAQVDLRPAASPYDNILFDTDSNGEFVIPDVAPGRYNLYASRSGYLWFEYPAPLTLTPNQRMTGLSLRMTKTAILAGRLVDEDGDPVPTAEVRVFNDKMQRISQATTPVRADGSFVIGDLRAGKYYVYAAENPRPANGVHEVYGPKEAFVGTYYPGVTDPARATLVSVEEGVEVRNLNFRMAKAHLSRVSGHVVDAVTGAPVGNAIVGLQRREPRSAQNLETASDGRFTFSQLSPGEYALYVDPRLDSPNMANLTARQTIVLGADNVDDVVLRAIPSIEVSGTISIADGGSVGGVRVQLLPEWWVVHNGPVDIHSDGTYLFRGLYPATYGVGVTRPPAGTYIKSVRWGGQDLAGGRIDLTSGAQGKTLEVVLAPHAAQVNGVVRDAGGAIVPGVSVSLHDSAGEDRTVTSDQNGAFAFRNLAPGIYKIAAFSGGRTIDWDQEGVALTLSENSRYGIDPAFRNLK